MFWEEFVGSWTAWLGCFFIVSSLWTIDSMLHSMRLCLAYLTAPADKKTEDILAEQEHKMRVASTSMYR